MVYPGVKQPGTSYSTYHHHLRCVLHVACHFAPDLETFNLRGGYSARVPRRILGVVGTLCTPTQVPYSLRRRRRAALVKRRESMRMWSMRRDLPNETILSSFVGHSALYWRVEHEVLSTAISNFSVPDTKSRLCVPASPMARLSTVQPQTPDPAAINLTRLLSRLEQILLTDTPEYRAARASSFERTKIATVRVSLVPSFYQSRLD